MGYPHFSGDCVDYHDRVIDWGGVHRSSLQPPPVKPAGVVTLCGSTKYMDAFISEQRRLTLEGLIVISVGLFGHMEQGSYVPGAVDLGTDDAPSDVKLMLDNLHFRKIDLANRIHVINPDGYIGFSTSNEVHYAAWMGREITYMDPESPVDPSVLEHVFVGNDRLCQRFGCGAARAPVTV